MNETEREVVRDLQGHVMGLEVALLRVTVLLLNHARPEFDQANAFLEVLAQPANQRLAPHLPTPFRATDMHRTTAAAMDQTLLRLRDHLRKMTGAELHED